MRYKYKEGWGVSVFLDDVGGLGFLTLLDPVRTSYFSVNDSAGLKRKYQNQLSDKLPKQATCLSNGPELD